MKYRFLIKIELRSEYFAPINRDTIKIFLYILDIHLDAHL